jgi:hypothetical protein
MTDLLSLFPRPEMDSKNPPDHRFVDLDAEARAICWTIRLQPQGAIAPFHFNDGFDQLLGRSFEALLPDACLLKLRYNRQDEHFEG